MIMQDSLDPVAMVTKVKPFNFIMAFHVSKSGLYYSDHTKK